MPWARRKRVFDGCAAPHPRLVPAGRPAGRQDFEPHIFEPQPRFRERLREIAERHGGIFHAKAVWKEGGKRLVFHAHKDEGGVGSSLYDEHAYGRCGTQARPAPLRARRRDGALAPSDAPTLLHEDRHSIGR